MNAPLTYRLIGKRVAQVATNGHVLRITSADGVDLDVVWVDDNGVPIKGRPAVLNHGPRLLAQGLQDLIHHPQIHARGHA